MVENGESNTNSTTASTNSNDSSTSKSSASDARTTVLDAGVVESRGFGGTDSQSRDELGQEIESFLQENTFSLNTEWRCLLGILIFVSTLPGPTWVKCHPGFLMKGMCYFPVVGTLVGLLVALVYDGCRVVLELPSVVAAAFSMAISFLLTGCLHEDGLADSADGIGGGWTRRQILRIMTDTRLGTFGSAALILYMFTKLELLAALDTSRWHWTDWKDWMTLFGFGQFVKATASSSSQGAGPAIVVAHTLARLTAPYLIHRNDYVEEDGPKSHFYSFMIRAKFLVSTQRVIFAVIYCFGFTTLLYGPWISLMSIVLVLIFSELAGYYGRYKLGGVMGDYLGATICLAEVLLLTYFVIPANVGGTQYGRRTNAREDGSFAEIVHAFIMDVFLPHDEQKLRVIVRTVVSMAVFQIWRWMIRGPTSVAPSSSSSMDTEKQVGTSTTTTPASSSPDKVAAQNVLSSTKSSFGEKYDAVQTYLDVLAKPVGSLGTLEEWATRLCTIQGTMDPKAEPVGAIIFAGDHGVAASPADGGEGCSLYPQAVTRAILSGLQGGMAGASVLAKANGATLSVVDVGIVGGPFDGPNVVSAEGKLVNGTKNFCLEAAMTTEEMNRCVQMGKDTVKQMVTKIGCTVIALGEVGIGNTTTASALIAALTDQPVDTVVGGGAFATRSIDESAVQKKIAIVRKAMDKHKGVGLMRESSAVLCKVGGAEIAALVGAILEASQRNIAVLVDGFIVTTAALVAAGMNPNVCRVLFFATKSAERGQIIAVQRIQSISRDNNLPIPSGPALSMGLRMGEGTGALLAVPILQSACSVVCNMATIQQILAPPQE